MEPIHPYGTKRPSLEQNFFDIFNQPNVSLVDLRKTPIERVTRSGIKTAAGEHDLDILVLATGFDAITGELTSINIRGTRGETLREKWAKGVRAHLGMAAADFPNLLFVYGPHSPNAFGRSVAWRRGLARSTTSCRMNDQTVPPTTSGVT